MQRLSILSFALIFSLCACNSGEGPSTPTFDGNKISYVEKGSGKYSILFIHGWCADKSYWESQIEHFGKDYHVVALDLAGHGESGVNRKNWTPENFARDVVAVANELELDNIVLVGHSIAEDILLRASRMLPKRTVAVVGVDNFKEVNVEMTDSLRGEVDRFFKLLSYDYKGASTAFAYKRLLVPGMKGKIRGKIMRDVTQADTSVAIPILRYLFEDFESERKFLKQIIVPLYLINSTYIPTDVAAIEPYCVNGFDIKNMEKTGHFPMLENPELFNQHLEEILSEIKDKRAVKKKKST